MKVILSFGILERRSLMYDIISRNLLHTRLLDVYFNVLLMIEERFYDVQELEWILMFFIGSKGKLEIRLKLLILCNIPSSFIQILDFS